MSYPLTLSGFEGQRIEVEPATMFSSPKLLVNGQPAQPGTKRGEMVLHRDDGAEVIARWKPQFLGLDVPALEVGNRTVHIVPPLKWYEWVWSALPVVLVVAGGFLGAVAGLIGLAINAKVFRSGLSAPLKYVASGAVSLAVVVVYVVFASLLLGAVGR
ncbi:MAG TPA: hypothetical protein VNL77_21015 [Roseiflexaceae bacterium]|nr:hypothetical protein [Roseiflexaceae bacterium]